jgi:multidrug resistance efflux pump
MVLTTENPPIVLLSKSTGKIDRLFVVNEELIDAGKIIALINSPTNFDQYLLMKERLNESFKIADWDTQVLTFELSEQLTLGEMQTSYASYLKNRDNLKQYLTQKFIPRKIALLRKQIVKQNEYYSTQLRQKELQIKDLKLSGKAFFRDSTLFQKLAISESEYEQARQFFLLKKSTFVGFEASLKNTESSILQMEENIVELQMQCEKDLAQYRLTLDEAKLNLENLIHQWEERYLVTSPVKGKITFTSVWSENQEVKTGDLIGTVIPQGALTIIVKAIVPTVGFGKVEVGQQVNIKLSGFPYMEFGMLKGHIRSISLVPEEKGYMADIELTGGMTSSYRENLKFIHQMDGTAEIVTKDLRLIYRFINPLRALLDKGL